MDETLDQLVRRVDEDRWLASRFAPAAARRRLIALYALNYEIARTSEAVSNPTFGDIRQAWWFEAIDEIYAGKLPRAFPALQAYCEAVAACGLKRAPLDALVAARAKDLDAAPFSTWDDLDLYLDGTAGNLLLLGANCVLAARAPPAAFVDFVRASGRAWGYAGLLRASEFWRVRGRSFYPTALTQHDEADLRAMMLERGLAAYGEARSLAPFMPAALFPVFGYLRFCKGYLVKIARGERAQMQLLMRQFLLVWGAATGKV